MASNDPGTPGDFTRKGDYYMKRGNPNMAESWNNTAKLTRSLDIGDKKAQVAKADDRALVRSIQNFAFR